MQLQYLSTRMSQSSTSLHILHRSFSSRLEGAPSASPVSVSRAAAHTPVPQEQYALGRRLAGEEKRWKQNISLVACLAAEGAKSRLGKAKPLLTRSKSALSAPSAAGAAGGSDTLDKAELQVRTHRPTGE